MTAKTIVIFRASIILLLLICLTLIAVYPVLAEDATTGAVSKKERIQQKIEARKEKVASREAILKTKLEAFKDKRKAAVAEKVNTNLNRINKNQSEQMLKHLDRMSSILNKLDTRVNNLTPDIKDAVGVKGAIARSREIIASASTAVNAQLAKDYTIQVTSETKVKADAKSKRDELHADLKAVRQLVIDAKQSVGEAIRTAKSGSTVKEGTASGQQ